LFVHRKDVIGRHVAKYGEYEPALTRWIDGRLAEAPPGLFVDIGANVGWPPLHAARHPSVALVVAFEPALFNAYLLDRSLCANRIDKVVVSTCGIGARPRTARLYRYKSSNLGRHSLLNDYGRGFRVVPQLDLDTALDELGFGGAPVSVLKIDVEGGEPEVIAGAHRTLERTDVVVHEFSPALSGAGGLSARDMLDRLEAAGFLPHTFAAGRDLVRTPIEELARSQGQVDIVWTKPSPVRSSIADSAPALPG